MDILKMAAAIGPLDEEALREAELRQQNLLKPMGSLGRLEALSIQIAGITGKVKNAADNKVLYLFGADNGVYEEGVAATPQHFTKTLMENYASGKKCAINVLCDHCGVKLRVVNMGDYLVNSRYLSWFWNQEAGLMDGTRNFSREPAMERKTALTAMEIGFGYAKEAKEQGIHIVGNGEVGMGNTTTAAACIMAACGLLEPEGIVGRGAGLTDKAFSKKKAVIGEALKKYRLSPDDPVAILSCVGGLDIGAMVGLYLGCGYFRLPIVADGVISMAAALLAYRLNPLIKDYIIPSHLSEEPAYRIAAEEMGLRPVLALNMRLGEGSGCPIMMQVVETALAAMNGMSTFEEEAMETDYREDITM